MIILIIFKNIIAFFLFFWKSFIVLTFILIICLYFIEYEENI